MVSFSLNYQTFWERFLEWYRGSLLDRFFSFLGERVFVVTFGDYEKIPLPPNAGETARNWILSFLVAFWIAAVTMAFVKSVPGGFVRRLLSLGALDADHAVTLAEAGFARSAAIRRDLLRGGALAKLLARPGDGNKTVAGTLIPDDSVEADPVSGESRPSLVDRLSAPEKPSPSPAENAPESSPEAPETAAPAPAPLDLAADRFYIPGPLRARAEIRFAKRGNSFLAAALSIVLSTIVAFLLCAFLPLLFRFGNFLLGG